MKVFTLGNGFIADHLPYPKISTRLYPDDREMGDYLADAQGGVLINCLGKTGRPNIDWCEKNQSETSLANVTLPLMIADWCKKTNTHLIHIGSGCVYFGTSPNYQLEWNNRDNPFLEETCERIDIGWKETDFANPQSFYSKTKYATDLVLGQLPSTTILRIRMPISERDSPRNLINKLRGYKRVIDIPNSVTFMTDLVKCVDWAIQNRPEGIFHVVNPRPLTAARIMKEYKRYVPEHIFDIMTERQLDRATLAKRSNCILSTKKINDMGFHLTNSEIALQQCMVKYIENCNKG